MEVKKGKKDPPSDIASKIEEGSLKCINYFTFHVGKDDPLSQQRNGSSSDFMAHRGKWQWRDSKCFHQYLNRLLWPSYHSKQQCSEELKLNSVSSKISKLQSTT